MYMCVSTYVCIRIMHIYIYIYTYTCLYVSGRRLRPALARAARLQEPGLVYLCICVSYYLFVFDSASLPLKYLNRLPGGCSGGEGTPPEALKCLTTSIVDDGWN